MNRLHLFATLILCSLVLTACSKDLDDPNGIPENAIFLTTEGFHNETKTSVQDYSVEWVTGDEVRIVNSQTNDRTVTVVPATGEAYIGEALGGSGAMRGYYPLSIITADGASDHATTPTIVVPDRYESHYSNGRQVIALPMIASADEGATTIQFQHVTAAVRVVIWNSTESPLVLDKVVVSSDHYKLSGTVSPNLTESPNLGIAAQSGDANDVTVIFTDSPVIAVGGYDTVQVPILPVNNDQEITIRIFTHVENAPWHKYAFSHHNTLPYNLTRNTMLTARCKIHTGEGNHVTESKFTINADGNQVYFSLGNLQYQASPKAWRFAEHQYDYIGNDNKNIANNYSGWIDLFGWGTSGYNHGAVAYQPYSTSKTDGEYSAYGNLTYSLYGYDGKADWGYNVISNGGNTENSGWRTPKMTEWTYLFETRSGSYKYAKGYIHSTKGLIIFPDGFNPSSFGVTITNANTSTASFTTYTNDEWTKMEDAGCIFLPIAGCREAKSIYDIGSYGRYWSSRYYSDNSAYSVNFNANSANFSTSCSTRHLGCSVRLVRNVN